VVGLVTTLVLCVSLVATTAAQEPADEAVTLARPSAAQYAYHEQERIQFLCLDPCTWQGREYDDHSTALSEMRLPKLDVDQWCEAAQSWGAKELLLVAKHTGGFCWWPTKTTEYCVRNIAWKDGEGDLVAEVAAACRRHGLKLGMYIYPGDDQWGAHIGSGGRTEDPAKQAEYDRVLRTQWTEVLSRHADVLIELWFDGSCCVPLGDVFERYVGDRVVYFQGPHATLRWVGTESGVAPYPAWNTLSTENLATGVATAVHSDPDGDAWAPLECDTTLYDHHWFWSAEKEKKRKSLEHLVGLYYRSVGRGATLLLNGTPNTDGLSPEGDVARYRGLGEELERRFRNPLGRAEGRGLVHTIRFDAPTVIDQLMVMEDYREGHRIREFVVEARTKSGEWVEVNRGTAVGRKRIVVFEPLEVTALSLRITKHVLEPIVRELAAYSVGGDNRFLYEPTSESEGEPWQSCGSVPAGLATSTVDLSPHIRRPGQYLLRLDAADGSPVEVESIEALYDGRAVHEGALSAIARNELYLLNRQAQVVEESRIELRLRLRTGSDRSPAVELSIRPAL